MSDIKIRVLKYIVLSKIISISNEKCKLNDLRIINTYYYYSTNN